MKEQEDNMHECVYCEKTIDCSNEPWASCDSRNLLRTHLSCSQAKCVPMFNDECSLRDWFAGQVASEVVKLWVGSLPDTQYEQAAEVVIAANAYRLADAMLKERERGEK